MYTQDQLVEYDEEVLHHVLQIKVTMNEDVCQLQGLIDVQDQELSSIKVEVDDHMNKLKASFNDTLKNTLDEHVKKINEQVQDQLVDIKSTLDNKIDSTKCDLIGQVHKVNQHVNDLRVEITKVADSLKSKHIEVNESLDNLLRCIEQSPVSFPMVPLAPPSYSMPLPPFGIPPSIVPPPIVDTRYSSMIPTENVALNEAPISSGFQYTGSVCSERKPLGAGNTSMSKVDEESVVPVNSSAYTVTTPTITAPSNAQPPFSHHNPQSTLGSQNQTRGYDGITNMWDNYQPNPQYRNYPQVPTDPSNNISLTPIEVVSDILEANQC